jgi:hypothetical protein
MKIFCSECKFFYLGDCYNPKNYKITPLARDVLDKECVKINANNNCSWYEKNIFKKVCDLFFKAEI